MLMWEASLPRVISYFFARLVRKRWRGLLESTLFYILLLALQIRGDYFSESE